MRHLPLHILGLLAITAGAVHAQPADPPVTYALPFASEGNVVELALGGDASDAAEVVVAQAPTWLAFRTPRADAVAVDASEPIAALTFDVAPDAPVGEPAEISLDVRSASGVVLATHSIRLEVEAPAELSVGLPRPNPSRSVSLLDIVVPGDATVRAFAYDVLGREVAVLADAPLAAGAHTLRLDTGALATGTYVVRVTSEASRERSVEVRRLTVVR
ncbi:MAG: T9SS type A sorting domain-containing protein [Bacteroidota bacterium]